MSSKEQDGPTEHTFDVKFDLNARFGGEQRIGLGGNVEYFNYSLPTMGGQEYLEFENHAEATLSPYYKVSGDNWNLKLGANIMFVTLSVRLVPCLTHIYGRSWYIRDLTDSRQERLLLIRLRSLLG